MMLFFLMTSFISYVTMICASCKNQFLHKSIKGVEIVKWQRKKCIRQSVLIVERNVKYHSSPMVADPYTAENVILNEDHHKDTKLTS